MVRVHPARLLGGTSFVFAAAGLALLFFPREAARALALDPAVEVPLQLVSGGLLAVAVLNWSGRGAIYGGIYGRPLVLANLTFGMVLGGSLFSATLDGRIGPVGWVFTGVMAIHVLFFGLLMRQPPWREEGGGGER